ncbi:hypothetical protein JL722_6814 [Aureococcus anophagefferens]|nr:hypothetical protein JL722_6814 [Aureococcus anophagefferens]
MMREDRGAAADVTREDHSAERINDATRREDAPALRALLDGASPFLLELALLVSAEVGWVEGLEVAAAAGGDAAGASHASGNRCAHTAARLASATSRRSRRRPASPATAEGLTPLSLACRAGAADCAALLLAAGAAPVDEALAADDATLAALAEARGGGRGAAEAADRGRGAPRRGGRRAGRRAAGPAPKRKKKKAREKARPPAAPPAAAGAARAASAAAPDDDAGAPRLEALYPSAGSLALSPSDLLLPSEDLSASQLGMPTTSRLGARRVIDCRVALAARQRASDPPP